MNKNLKKGLIIAGIIAISIALDEWSKNDKGN